MFNVFPGTYIMTFTPEFPYSPFITILEVSRDAGVVRQNVQVKPASIMLIDDDGGKSYETYYTPVLNSLNMPYTRWEEETGGIVPLQKGAAMLMHPLTIWFTGDDRDSALGRGEQDSIRAFLASGGRLLLSGQNILECLDSTDFAASVLQCRFVGNTSDHLLQPKQENPILGKFQFLYTSGAGGAKNQNSSDILEVIGQAQPFAYYDTTSNEIAGVLVDSAQGNGRLIFCGFGLEAITVPASRTDFLSREQFLHNAIDWLAGTTLVPVNSYIPQVVPELHGLLSLFPNPVHLSGKDSGLTIRFQLPGHVIPTRIQVYDLLGRRICSLDLSPAQKRRREISLVPGRKSNLHSGVYFVVLEAERLKLTKKFLVLR